MDAVEAAASVDFDDVNDCLLRIIAILQFRREPAFKVLAASYKRIKNIVKDNRETTVDSALFTHQAESDLFKLFIEVEQEMKGYLAEQHYEAALQAMLRMKEPVDAFFDGVMVMAEDPAVRGNRLNLLTALGALILNIGDISLLQEN
jgi:glycyl-tRNA synthetase beta chain